MRYTLGFIAGIVFILVLARVLPEPEGRVYDCNMADWHPDIPLEVRQECRRLRHEEWKRQEEENKRII